MLNNAFFLVEWKFFSRNFTVYNITNGIVSVSLTYIIIHPRDLLNFADSGGDEFIVPSLNFFY